MNFLLKFYKFENRKKKEMKKKIYYRRIKFNAI